MLTRTGKLEGMNAFLLSFYLSPFFVPLAKQQDRKSAGKGIWEIQPIEAQHQPE
jgi:hypothetical protein